eukprot:2575978-Heterocapsa_arctica.AAC.1
MCKVAPPLARPHSPVRLRTSGASVRHATRACRKEKLPACIEERGAVADRWSGQTGPARHGKP